MLDITFQYLLERFFFIGGIYVWNADLVAVAEEAERRYHLLKKEFHNCDPLAEA